MNLKSIVANFKIYRESPSLLSSVLLASNMNKIGYLSYLDCYFQQIKPQKFQQWLTTSNNNLNAYGSKPNTIVIDLELMTNQFNAMYFCG